MKPLFLLFLILPVLARAESPSEADLDKLLDISDAILGKSFCALGDGAASPIISSLKYLRRVRCRSR